MMKQWNRLVVPVNGGNQRTKNIVAYVRIKKAEGAMNVQRQMIGAYIGRHKMSDETMTEACCSCKWYRKFEGVCTNGESEYCADFTSSDDYCGLWEGIE